MILPVVLAGGVGSRLWPVSRALLPKQFAHLPGQTNTLFQETVLRLDEIVGTMKPLVICHEEHRFLAAEQLRQLEPSQLELSQLERRQHDSAEASILLEPISRNTAPAVAVAAFHATSTNQDPVLLILPSDHIITNSQALSDAIEVGLTLAEEGHLVTFGVTPVSPETGYGYIERGQPLAQDGAWVVKEFKEKPHREVAEQFIASDSHFWNSGMFMFRASAYLNQLELLAPDIYSSCKHSYEAANPNPDFISIPLEPYAKCRDRSIDYAVMEKTEKAAVISLAAGWNDLGSWDAMWQLQSKDDEGNSIEGDVFTAQVQRCLIHSESRLVAAVGLSDMVIVETADAVLVTTREQAQSVKEVVAQIEFAHRDEAYSHTKVHAKIGCSWGNYELLFKCSGYQIIRLFVSPGASYPSTSLSHTAEQLFLLKGGAELSHGDSVFSLVAGDSTSIPAGTQYVLANESNSSIELIKVQLKVNICEDESA